MDGVHNSAPKLELTLLAAILILPFFPRYTLSQTSSINSSMRNQNHDEAPLNAHTIHVQSPLVVAPVSVTDASGHFVEDLRKTDFTVLDDGVPQPIARCELNTEPAAAVIVIQANDSVAPLLGVVHPLGPLFSDLLLGPQGQAAVIAYSDKIQVVQKFSNDPAALTSTLRGISAEGGRARLNDALELAISMLAARKRPERRIIIAISEGFDRGSATHPAEVIRAASESNVEIYGLRFNPAKTTFEQDEADGMFDHTLTPCSAGPPGTPVIACRFRVNLVPFAVLALQTGVKELRTNALQQYAGYTGGLVYTHLRKRSIEDLLQNIALDLNSQYILTYTPNTLKKPGFHPIQVDVTKPGLVARTRAGYFYGATGQ